jgi:hypothetical protein
MAATVLTINTIDTEATLTQTFEDMHDADGGKFKNTGREFVALHNSHAEDSATATLVAEYTSLKVPDIGNVTKANIAVSLAAGQTKIIGPLPRHVFNDADGNVQINVGGTAAAALQALVFKSADLRA